MRLIGKYANAKTCSGRCRTRLCRARKKSNHQLRLQAAALDPRPQHAAINYTIEQVDAREAAAFVRRYEYLGDAGHPLSCYGARNAAGELAAVVIFGRPAVTLDQNTIVLERGACAHWAHRHTASWFINRACKMATRDRGWHLFVAYADPAASERGVIFRAAGWHYCGQGRANGRPREYFRQRGSRQWICDRTFFSHRRLTMTDVALGDWHRKTLPAKHVFRVCLS